MDPSFSGTTIIEDNLDGAAQILLGAFAKKFSKRSYRIFCLADDNVATLLEKALGDLSGIRVLRIDDPLAWDGTESETNGALRDSDTLVQTVKAVHREDLDKKTALLLPCLSSVWLSLGHVETMRFLVKIRPVDDGQSSFPVVGVIAGRLLTPAQIDQLKHVSIAWAAPSMELTNSTNESAQYRFRVEHAQLKNAKINEKTVVVDVTKAFDVTVAPKTDTVSKRVEKSVHGESDPTAGLTFNLKLKETEAVAKNNVQLPHLVVRDSMRTRVVGSTGTSGGRVFYTPDEADDFDDEDPDADLDI